MARYRRPNVIGRYRITGLLGEGGMGAVYRAEQDQPHRSVALKVIRPDFVSAELVHRFSRESEVLGRLQHPGIAQIYEAGTAEGPHGPQAFFAMELVEGSTLDVYAESNRLSTDQRLELFIKVCEAVNYAHQRGVIHRDLKPANILVDRSGQPKILDFGVARVTDADVKATMQTSVGQVIGTLQYMSPEQVLADPLDLDTRSDVYSLGVILYELLSGKLPYDLGRKVIHEAARIIAIEEPAPLSSVNRNLRGDVETIVVKALEKEKARRYSSAEELASDVRRYLTDQPISARPASAMYQLVKFARRNRALVGGLALAAIILIIGTITSTLLAIRATAAERLADTRRTEAEAATQLAQQRQQETAAALVLADSARADAQREQATALREKAAATASATRATREASKATAVSVFLQDMLYSADPSIAQGRDLTVREVLDKAAAQNRSNLTGQPEVQAAVEGTIGAAYRGLGKYDQARAHLDSSLAIQRRAEPGSIELANWLFQRGQLAAQEGDFPLAERYYRESLAIYRSKGAPDDDHVTDILSQLAFIRYSRNDREDAERLHLQAIALTKKRHPAGGVLVANRLGNYATFLVYTNRPDQAIPVFKESLAISRAALGDKHPEVIATLLSLGTAQNDLSQMVPAESTFRQGLALAREVYGSEHPFVADFLDRLGVDVGWMQRRYEEGQPLLREALAMRIKLLGEQHPDVQLSRANLGRSLLSSGNFAEAETLFKASLAGRRQALGDSNPAVASSLVDLGLLSEAQFKWAEAERYYRESIPIWRLAKDEFNELYAMGQIGWDLGRINQYAASDSVLLLVLDRQRALFGPQHPRTGDTYEKLQSNAVFTGRLARADSLATAALDIRKATWGPKSQQVADQLQNMAFIRERANDSASAIPVLREALEIYQSVRPPTDANVVLTQQWLGADLCTVGDKAEGMTLIQTALANAPPDSTRNLFWRIRGAVGYCLGRQGKYAEAEPLLLVAEENLRKIPNTNPVHINREVARLAELYQRWGKPELAEAWKAKLPK